MLLDCPWSRDLHERRCGIMEIYTPVHMDCMCYVSGCNLHGGYNMMLLMVYLGRTLKLMQNGLRTTGICYNTVKMRFMCMWMFFVNLMEKKNVFGTEIHLQRGFLDCKWIWRWFWYGRLFGQAQRCFSNTCACVFNQSRLICFLYDAFYFRKLPTIFVNSLDVFEICANSAFEEKMEVEMIYFWKDGEFSLTEFTNMLMMFVYRRRCMLQRQSSWNRRSPTITCCMCMTDNFLRLRVFPVWKKDLRVCSEAVVFWGIRV